MIDLSGGLAPERSNKVKYVFILEHFCKLPRSNKSNNYYFMPYCEKCGASLSQEAQFCPNCGTPVVRAGKKEPATHTPQPETGSGTKLNAGNLYGRINLEKLPKGHLIDDRYEIIRKLGQGGFGAVYLANDLKMEMHKVLKVIPEVISNDKKAMILLRKEASIMAKLNHKNIVRVYDFHDNGDINYIDMEYVEGQSLADLLLKTPENKLPEEEVKKYAIQIAEGLAYAHNQRVIHKDIKPQNIMRTNDVTIKLMDFGIAETVHSSMSRLKNTGSSGTLVYMSPEQLRGKDVGKESDIYSLGATLYELLTGNPPFYQGDIYSQIINEQPEPVHNVSEPLNALILKCIEKEKENRFRNCDELSDALKNPEKFLKNKTVKIKEQHQSGTIKSNDISDNAGGKKRQTWVPWTIFLFLIAAGMASYFLFSKQFENYTESADNLDIEMVAVKGGTFQMGSNDGADDEKPVHTVTLSNYYIGKYEVTQKQWQAVMGNNPSYFKGDNLPVEQVSWYDVQAFLRKLNQITGKHYRLPTEAEWEYAARGGNKSRGYTYSGSDNLDQVAWYWKNSGNEVLSGDWSTDKLKYNNCRIHPVGQKTPNELSIYDMSGNVFEWCSDWHNANYYSHSLETNPQVLLSGTRRVNRGGSWGSKAVYCRVADRNKWKPVIRYYTSGFRLALSVP